MEVSKEVYHCTNSCCYLGVIWRPLILNFGVFPNLPDLTLPLARSSSYAVNRFYNEMCALLSWNDTTPREEVVRTFWGRKRNTWLAKLYLSSWENNFCILILIYFNLFQYILSFSPKNMKNKVFLIRFSSISRQAK